MPMESNCGLLNSLMEPRYPKLICKYVVYSLLFFYTAVVKLKVLAHTCVEVGAPLIQGANASFQLGILGRQETYGWCWTSRMEAFLVSELFV